MVSNQYILDLIAKVRETTRVELFVFTPDGLQFSSENVKRVNGLNKAFRVFEDSDSSFHDGNDYYVCVKEAGRTALVLRVKKGDKEEAVAEMSKLQIAAVIATDEEQSNREKFIKNLLLDNLLLGDINNRARALGIEIEKKRVAFLIDTKEKDDTGAYETLRTMFADNEGDFIAALDENNIIYIRELQPGETEEDLRMIANTISDMLNTEAMISVRVSFGNIADEIRKVANSYKEAKMALSVGKVFNSEQNVVSYSSLGIGRLIYQLPLPMCKMFIEEIFKAQSPDDFDDEMLQTINQFFENDLNVSKTSDQLYIHRNTLVYRLDKIKKNTGLDLHVFNDAITLKIALMVVKYIHYMENQD